MINERYIINKILGEGRSKVFLCQDIDFPEKNVALKVLPFNVSEEELITFRKEYFTLQKLQHPNIITAIELGTIVSDNSKESQVEVGSKFITLEVFEGKELLNYKNCRDENILKDILIQISSVLYYLHQSNYIYYDLKPENILVAEKDNKPIIKLIDLGFARHAIDDKIPGITGTMQYIAPELLKKEDYDHRIDLYSLGMLLYRIIYDAFPFETDDQIKILKAQIENEFEYPESNFSEEFINIVKKLLIKDAELRYQSCLELLSDLGVKFENEITNQWMPAKVSTDRKDAIAILKKYLDDNKSNEIFSIRGTNGSGKSTVAEEIYSTIPGTIIIRNNKNLNNTDFIKFIVKQIIYNDHVYSRLNNVICEKVEQLFKELPENLIDELKIIFTNIATNCKFSLILDDFNRYDTFTYDTLIILLPILQVNKVKVILTEDSDKRDVSNKVYNLRTINLSPLTEQQLEQMINRSLNKSFPKKEIKNLIMLHADLLPGGIRTSIKDMLLLNILSYNKDGVNLNKDEQSIELLKSSQEEIYKIRLKSLNEKELEFIQLFSAIDINLGVNSLSMLAGSNLGETDKLLLELQKKEIIKQYSISGMVQFSSDGLKSYVYSLFENKEEYHLKLAVNIESTLKDFNKNELARQYELAKEDEKSYTLLMEVADDAEKISAFSYEKQILEHLLILELKEEKLNIIKYKLAILLDKLGEYKHSLDFMNNINYELLNSEEVIELQIAKGHALIETDDLENGKKLLEGLLSNINNTEKKYSVLSEIARADLDLGNFDDVTTICSDVITDIKTLPKEKGRANATLALKEIYKNNDFDKALELFLKAEEIFQQADLKVMMTRMGNNIGNIYNIKNDYPNAELYWNKAVEMNKSIGNLENEALLTMNLGIYHFEQFNLQKSIDLYNRAYSIFQSIGDVQNQGILKSNLGENYIFICEYQKALEELELSKSILSESKNENELVSTLFPIAQLYHIIGDKVKLNSVIKEFEKYSEKKSISEQNKNNFNYLKVIMKINTIDMTSTISELNKIKEIFLSNEDSYHFFQVVETITCAYLNNSKFNEAIAELEKDDLKKLCSKNKYYNARRDILYADLAQMNTELKLNSAIEYFEKAYDFIEDFNIIELTWNVLYKIADFYFARGNKLKAKEFANYTKATIEHIAEKITDANLLQNYLTEESRQKALISIGEIIKN